MPMIECVLVVQTTNGERSPDSSSALRAGYAVWILLAIVLGLMALIFIRASARRSKR